MVRSTRGIWNVVSVAMKTINGSRDIDVLTGYRRTVLVVWPHSRNLHLVCGNGPSFAITQLSKACFDEPNAEERRLVEYLLRRVTDKKHGTAVLRCVCNAACKWKNGLPLWTRAVRMSSADQGVSLLGQEGVMTAISSLGFHNVLPMFVFPWCKFIIMLNVLPT